MRRKTINMEKNPSQGIRYPRFQVLTPWLAKLQAGYERFVGSQEKLTSYLLQRAETEAKTPKSPPNRIIFSLFANCSVRAMTIREMPDRR